MTDVEEHQILCVVQRMAGLSPDKSHRNVNNVIKVEILILLLCVIGCVAEFMENLMRV